MAIKPTDAKKLADQFNTRELSHLIEVSDELMRVVMEAGEFDKAEGAAQAAAEMSAALVVRKEGGVRELARRVRDRVTEDKTAPGVEAQPAETQPEFKAADTDPPGEPQPAS
ncbi:MAG: hypothetical protein HY774_20635 [Acidobacteria bacterium]|nr:hypothetical protein [Acidobacteriota bacterium]